TGTTVLQDVGRTSEFRPGPVFTDLLLADEINRAPAKTQAALLEAMQERQVTVDGTARSLGPLFTVFATQNPVEYEGTYPLPEAQLDRFLLKIKVAYPSKESELAILDNYAAGFDAERASDLRLEPVLDANSCAEVRAAADGVTVAPEVREYITQIVRATREETALTLGGSPRATVALFRVSRAAALLAGRNFVTPDDVKDYAFPVLRHRVVVSPEVEVEGRCVAGGVDAGDGAAMTAGMPAAPGEPGSVSEKVLRAAARSLRALLATVPTRRLVVVTAVLAPVWMASGTPTGGAVALFVSVALVAAVALDMLTLPAAWQLEVERVMPERVGLGDMAEGRYMLRLAAGRALRVS